MANEANHIRISNEPGTIGVMTCTHCGAIEKLPNKAPFDSVLAWTNAFMRSHKNCQKQEENEREN